MRLLLFYGADATILANGGSHPLAVAKTNGHLEMVEVLSGVDELNSQDDYIEHRSVVELPSSTLDVLIPDNVDHPGAGSYVIDHSLAEESLDTLISLRKTLPIALTDKKKQKNIILCSSRYYFCDSHGWVRKLLETAISSNLPGYNSKVLPHMRFLHYEHAGSVLAPHVDLCRVDTDSGQRSTHTFILYLYSCGVGGETVLLQAMTSDEALATVTPTRGRLLLFPHNCPHMGATVVDVPKLLLRGEVVLVPNKIAI